MRVINRIVYFLADYVNFLRISLIVIGITLTITVNLQIKDMVLPIVITTVLTPFLIFYLLDSIISADFKKLTKKVKYEATKYSEVIMLINRKQEYLYLIEEENAKKRCYLIATDDSEKTVEKDTVHINNKIRLADNEHKVGSTDMEYIEVEYDKNLPEYKRNLFDQRMRSKNYKYKNQLNIINYVSKEVLSGNYRGTCNALGGKINENNQQNSLFFR